MVRYKCSLGLGNGIITSCVVYIGSFHIHITMEGKPNRRKQKNTQMYDDFRYKKFIYLHCGEKTKLRDPRS